MYGVKKRSQTEFLYTVMVYSVFKRTSDQQLWTCELQNFHRYFFQNFCRKMRKKIHIQLSDSITFKSKLQKL